MSLSKLTIIKSCDNGNNLLMKRSLNDFEILGNLVAPCKDLFLWFYRDKKLLKYQIYSDEFYG